MTDTTTKPTGGEERVWMEPPVGPVEIAMLALAKAHDEVCSPRERGAECAIRTANGMACSYWAHLARAIPTSPADEAAAKIERLEGEVERLREALMAARDTFTEIVRRDIHHSGPDLDTDDFKEGEVSSTWVGDLGRLAKSARNKADASLQQGDGQ